MKLAICFAAAATFAAIGGVLYHLSIWGFATFLVSTLAAWALTLAFHVHLANWWYGNQSTNERDGGT